MIETPRLRLRPVQAPDLPRLVEALNDWGVTQWLARPPFPYAQADAETFMAWSQPPVTGAPPRAYAVADRETNRLLGVVGLDPQEGWAELGYWLAAAAQGRGLMREAVAALLQADAPRLPPIYATTEPDNHRSQALLRAVGFGPTGVLPRGSPSRRGALHVLRFERPLRAGAGRAYPDQVPGNPGSAP